MAWRKRAVLITGSSTGIGEACTSRLAAAGWKVYAGVRRSEDGDRLKAAYSGDIEPVIIDVCQQESIDAAIAHITAAGCGLDGLVNNAGVGAGGPIEVLDVDDWRVAFETNFFGLIASTKAAFPLIDAADGRFVHIGSIAGRVASPGMGPYAASKHAVEAQVDDTLKRLEREGLTDRYQWLIDMFRGFLAHAQANAIDPDKVAVAVEHALTSKRPKARYLVGTDAKVQSKIALLPDRAREFALRTARSTFIKNGTKIRTGDAT